MKYYRNAPSGGAHFTFFPKYVHNLNNLVQLLTFYSTASYAFYVELLHDDEEDRDWHRNHQATTTEVGEVLVNKCSLKQVEKS